MISYNKEHQKDVSLFTFHFLPVLKFFRFYQHVAYVNKYGDGDDE